MSYPKSLIKSVLDDCKPVVICTKAAYNELLNTDVTTLFLQNNWVKQYEDEINRLPVKPIREHALLDDMAYTVYSSGTTGRPKGIVCPHRGAVFSYKWRHLAFPYDDDDEREACNVFFVWEMLRPLLKGGFNDLLSGSLIQNTMIQAFRCTLYRIMLFTIHRKWWHS